MLFDENLIKDNKRLIYFFINKYKHIYKFDPMYSKDDLEQELIITMMKAFGKFDPDRGVKFSTFLYPILNFRCLDLFKKINNKTKSNFIFQSIDDDEKTDLLNVISDQDETNKDHNIIIDQLSLEEDESQFLRLFLSGEKLKDIKQSGINVNKIRSSLRKKVDKTLFYA